MIKLSNGHCFEHMVASGALAYDGKGWPWERPLVWFGFIEPWRFTVVTKTLTRNPRPGNLHWRKPWTWLPFSPWSCVRFLPGGVVNKVGLTNPGIDWWCEKVAPKIDFDAYPIAVSIFGTEEELIYMAERLNRFNIRAVEVNISCPNTGHAMAKAAAAIGSVAAVKKVSRHPVIVKVSVDQPYLEIVQGLKGIAEAVSLNSVPWEKAYPEDEELQKEMEDRVIPPLRKLAAKTDGKFGGVSGKPAQLLNWRAVREMAQCGSVPVIGPSVMEYGDIGALRYQGATAVSFGSIHLHAPWKPTAYVKADELAGRKK